MVVTKEGWRLFLRRHGKKEAERSRKTMACWSPRDVQFRTPACLTVLPLLSALRVETSCGSEGAGAVHLVRAMRSRDGLSYKDDA